MPRYRYLLIALAVWAAAWSGYQFWPAAKPSQADPVSPPISKADFAELEKLAASACECWMDGGDRAKCDRGYEKAKARYAPTGVATACAPISTEMDCFGEEGRQCIVTGYSVVGVDGDNKLCRQKDAQAVEAAWSKTYNSHPKNGDVAHNAANAAIRDVLKKIKEGGKLAATRSTEGCV